MTRTNQHGKEIRRVLEWLLNRDLTDKEMADAIGKTTGSYSRRKDDEDFPSFEELEKLGQHFNINATMLHIAFGHLGTDALALLDDTGMKQYWEQGGKDATIPPTTTGGKGVRWKEMVGLTKIELSPRDDINPF